MEVDPRQYDNIAINDDDIHDIVISYLMHNCYNETLESYIACTGVKRPSYCLDDLGKRKRIIQAAQEGNALKSIELVEQFAPDLLERDEDLRFDLLTLQYVELVRFRKSTEALEFAQDKLTPFGKVKKYIEKLEDFMALLAYEEPEKCPMFHLVRLEFRQQVAETLNRAILAYLNSPNLTPLEKLIQQTTVVHQCLNHEFGKDGPPQFIFKDFIRN